MKKIVFFFVCYALPRVYAQPIVLNDPVVIQGVLIKITPPLDEFVPDPAWVNEIVRDENGVINENKQNIEHRIFHPNAVSMPKGRDPVIQDFQYSGRKRITSIIQNFQGHGNTAVSPADPSLCVGPNHVIQMINGSSGARMTIYNKTGGTVVGAQYIDAITGIPGLGDPVCIYDQFANRFVMTEFASSGNRLVIMVSQTSNPAGSWYVYQFTTPDFPDYPKYGVWPNAYICTTNESDNKVYAFDRVTMLTGAVTTTMIAFTIPFSPTISFQAASPVDISGTAIPPAGTKPLILRMTDNGWGGGAIDALEMWELNPNFIVPGLSTFTQLPSLPTAAFTTDLCGYITLNCIRQPGSQRLDPVREVIMNRVWYRNFGTHQSIVLSHTVDATGLDQAGIRWYELRRTGLGPWSIYQQSTYAPDTNSRWMGTIGINGEGSIGLAYNVSSKNVFPSFRFTGRKETDLLNTMSETEQTIIAGSTNHTNNRWGDYNDMQVDPSDDFTFWTTGMYMPNPAPWTTRIASFNILYSPLPVTLLSFEGRKVNDAETYLEWETAHENNLQSYEVERAFAGTDKYVAISTVPSANSVSRSNYTYKDLTINRLENYNYRLKMVDIDGKYRYSHVVNIKGSVGEKIEIYPNPVKSNTVYARISQEMSEQAITFTFFNFEGKKIRTIRKSKYDSDVIQAFDITALTPGVYVLQCTGPDGEVILNKNIVKE